MLQILLRQDLKFTRKSCKSWLSLVWDQAVEEKGTKRGQLGKYRRAKRAQRWPGEGEGVVPPFPHLRLHLSARFARRIFSSSAQCGAWSQASFPK